MIEADLYDVTSVGYFPANALEQNEMRNIMAKGSLENRVCS